MTIYGGIILQGSTENINTNCSPIGSEDHESGQRWSDLYYRGQSSGSPSFRPPVLHWSWSSLTALHIPSKLFV